MSLINRDPGDENNRVPLPDPLFPVAKTAPKRCRHCSTTRSSLCLFDADRAHGIGNPRALRPRSCLNTPSQTSKIPY